MTTHDTVKRPAADELRQLIVASLEDDKAEDVSVISLGGKSSLADFMVIASGRSSRQVLSMADHIIRLLKSHGISGVRPEGARQGDWVLIDAGDVIIHLFRPEVRSFYNLEKMWSVPMDEVDHQASARA